MGSLIGKAYPTNMLFGLADHTYVECGTGVVGWSCWGGKTGGREIVRSAGSTLQANTIANADERAGITCYGVNGVCHQAANRILWPSRTLVSAATGYWVSSSLFGTYGKENRNLLHVCEAPFVQHNTVTGDLPNCVEAAPSSIFSNTEDVTLKNIDISDEKAFAEAAMSLLSQVNAFTAEDIGAQKNYQIEHFSLQSKYRLGSLYSETLDKTLRNLRTDIEDELQKIEMEYANNQLDIKEFAEIFNKLTIKFQDHMAETLKPEYYRAYFRLERSDRVIILDPEIIDKIHKET